MKQGLVTTTYKPKFAYFNAMSFARDEVEAADTSGNIEEEEEYTYSEEQVSFGNQLTNQGACATKIDIKMSPTNTGTSNIRRQVLTSESIDDEEEDMTFFHTLLRYVNRIPDSKKLVFRTKINAIVHKYVFGEEDEIPLSSNSSTTTDTISSDENPDLTSFRTLRHFTKRVVIDDKLAMRIDIIQIVRAFAFPKNKRQKNCFNR